MVHKVAKHTVSAPPEIVISIMKMNSSVDEPRKAVPATLMAILSWSALSFGSPSGSASIRWAAILVVAVPFF
jgi:hypothetical protein